MSWVTDKLMGGASSTAIGFYHSMGVDPIGQITVGGEQRMVGAFGGMGGDIAVGRPSIPMILDPKRSASTGVAGVSHFQQRIAATNPKLLWNAGNKLGAVGAVASPLLNVGLSLGFVGMQAVSEGPMAAGQAFLWDVAVNSALVKHGYKNVKLAAGVSKMVPKGMFGGLSLAGRGIAGYAGAMAGGALGGMAGGAPGSILGTGFGMVGAKLGVMGAPMLPGLLAAGAVAGVAGYGAYSVMKAGYNHAQMQKQIHTSGSMAGFYTQGAHTMRSRAVSAIHKSHMNSRSALGQEANYLHAPSRNYHSRYRL